MRPSRSVSPPLALATAAAAGLAALVGCQPKPKPAPAPQPAPASTSAEVQQTQTMMMTIDPKARVGHVADVDPRAHMAAVAGIPLADVKVGDTISFLTGDHQTLANGTIQTLDSTQSVPIVIVDYSIATGGRDPADNDLAVTVPLGR